ncbi:TetR/AcrR family transcriptional regulator [Rubrobacter aplysinae]|uniref:TetR/AcrR family transcriptional regulator n=1 Tax=Rubrobacter aplysinae TaxID=909625 RepID=UPI0009FEA324|nr:TetR/AcrR family transcriptional regulator [Rubrobacter aplysinae]
MSGSEGPEGLDQGAEDTGDTVEDVEGAEGGTEESPEEGAGELSPAASRILEAASRLFYEQGIRAVGVDAIVEEADVAKVTLYNNFGSKDELAAAYVRERRGRWQRWIQGFVDEAEESSRKLVVIFDALERWLEVGGYRGSAAINAFSEISDPEHPARVAAQEYKEWTQGYLKELAGEAGSKDPDKLAERIWILLEGATITSVMEESSAPVHEARELAQTLV